MLPSQARLLLCHLDNDLVIIIYIYCSSAYTYDLHKPYLGAFFFSQYPSVALPIILIFGTRRCIKGCSTLQPTQVHSEKKSITYLYSKGVHQPASAFMIYTTSVPQ